MLFKGESRPLCPYINEEVSVCFPGKQYNADTVHVFHSIITEPKSFGGKQNNCFAFHNRTHCPVVWTRINVYAHETTPVRRLHDWPGARRSCLLILVPLRVLGKTIVCRHFIAIFVFRSLQFLEMLHRRRFVFSLLVVLAQQCLAIGQEPLYTETSVKNIVLTDDLIAFHKNLTEIESITYNEEAVGKWLLNSLESQGYHVEKQFVDEEAGRFNIYAYPGHTKETKVLVSSHIDTVRQFVFIQLILSR